MLVAQAAAIHGSTVIVDRLSATKRTALKQEDVLGVFCKHRLMVTLADAEHKERAFAASRDLLTGRPVAHLCDPADDQERLLCFSQPAVSRALRVLLLRGESNLVLLDCHTGAELRSWDAKAVCADSALQEDRQACTDRWVAAVFGSRLEYFPPRVFLLDARTAVVRQLLLPSEARDVHAVHFDRSCVRVVVDSRGSADRKVLSMVVRYDFERL